MKVIKNFLNSLLTKNELVNFDFIRKMYGLHCDTKFKEYFYIYLKDENLLSFLVTLEKEGTRATLWRKLLIFAAKLITVGIDFDKYKDNNLKLNLLLPS